MSAVDVEGVSRSYGLTTVLSGVSIGFEAGKFTSLLGPSGSGKTTLLRIIAGFVNPDRGRISIAGADVTQEPVWKRRIGMVFQSYALFPHMSVAQNVVFGLHRRGVRGAEANREVARALELVRLTGFENRRPKQLSGGQQQRVALARAIVTNPTVLLLDEPLSALDRRLRHEMQVELRRIQRESGLTTIFVTHDQEEALTLSDRIAILDRGRIVQDGAPGEIYEHPRTRFSAAFLGDANFLTGITTPEGVQVGGRLLRSSLQLPAQGTTVTLAVRPEKIAFVPAGTPEDGSNRLEAIVRQVVYAGASSTYRLDCPAAGIMDGTFRVFAQNREGGGPQVGEKAHLAFSPAHAVPLED
jgi:putative spermidine/putrescine transport system ATP-binding protein/spermidine/putrescine transport system ATP-binding protein